MPHSDSNPPGWLEPAAYASVQASVPLVCVDLLPWRHGEEGLEIGLIRRRCTDSERLAWGLVGGRVRYDEPLRAAIARHLQETLGTDEHGELDAERPALVAQYSPRPREEMGLDARQHSVALCWPLEITGEAHPRGEALVLAWFYPQRLPNDAEMLPGVHQVMQRLLVLLT